MLSAGRLSALIQIIQVAFLVIRASGPAPVKAQAPGRAQGKSRQVYSLQVEQEFDGPRMSAIMRRILSPLLLQQTMHHQETHIARNKPFGNSCGP
jgi:hypothetical protein